MVMDGSMDTPQSEWTDTESRMLLTLLYKYVKEFEPDIPPSVEHLAEDLAQSMDETSNHDDEMYRFIAKAYHWDRVATAPQDKPGWPTPPNLER
jgi:uncharacterized protein YktB (UPF0637 family)